MKKYLLYVITLSDLFFFIHKGFTQQNVTDPWTIPLTVSCSGETNSLFFGTMSGATNGFDIGKDILAPPPPPSGLYSFFQVSGIFSELKADYRSNKASSNSWTLKINQTEGASGTISWDSSGFPTIGIVDSLAIEGINMMTQSSIPFTGDQTLIISYSILIQGCDIILHPNWNMISFNITLNDSSVAAFVSPLGDEIRNICGFVAGEGFKTWDANRPAFLNDLNYLDPRHGYWIKLESTDPETLSVEGNLCSADTPIQLLSNWNLISYLPDQPDSIYHAFLSLNDEYTLMLGYEGGIEGGFRTWDRNRPSFLNDLHILKPGFGYWVKMNSNATLNYPVSGYLASGTVGEGPHPSIILKTKEITSTPYCFDIWAVNQNFLSPDQIVEVYDETDILCGIGSVNARNGVLIHVYGDDPLTEIDEGASEGETLSIFINGLEVEIIENLVWTDKESKQINFLDTVSDVKVPNEFTLSQNYPNPFNPETNLNYYIPKSSHVKITIINISGEKIRTLVDEEHQAGSYMVTWQGTDNAGNRVGSGIYFVTMEFENSKLVHKMTFLK